MTAATRDLLPIDEPLAAALRDVAGVPKLLVASAFNGTLAPLPEGAARPSPDESALRAIRRLAGTQRTTTAVVSGLSLRDLALASRLPAEVILVGSYGAETGPDLESELDPSAVALLDRICEEARSIATAIPGARFERKPAGLAVHLGGVDVADARWVRERVHGGLAVRSGVRVVDSVKVVELTVAQRDKGAAIEALRVEHAADAVVYLGDDNADEAAFKTLGEADVGIRVGHEDSAAGYGVADTEGAVAALELLAQRRS